MEILDPPLLVQPDLLDVVSEIVLVLACKKSIRPRSESISALSNNRNEEDEGEGGGRSSPEISIRSILSTARRQTPNHPKSALLSFFLSRADSTRGAELTIARHPREGDVHLYAQPLPSTLIHHQTGLESDPTVVNELHEGEGEDEREREHRYCSQTKIENETRR